MWNFSLVDWTPVGGFLLTESYCVCFSRDSWRLWNLVYGLMMKLKELFWWYSLKKDGLLGLIVWLDKIFLGVLGLELLWLCWLVFGVCLFMKISLTSSEG